MSTSNDPRQSIAAWLEAEAPDRAPTRLIEASRERIRTTQQRRAWWPAGRGSNMYTFAKLGLTVVAVAAFGVVGLTLLRGPVIGPAASPTAELGIFAPVAGRIVSGVWAVNPEAVDPSAPSRWTPLRMGPEEVLAVGWSSNGTELLFMRKDPTQTFPFATNLFILHADGTETQLTKDGIEMWGATIAPDGSRVVYAARDVDAARSVPPSLFAVDAKGGQPIRIADEGERPTFSPDGSQIAYVVNNTGEAHVWVADADGSDAHEILADEPALVVGADELAWSPAGDRIAIGNSLEGRAAIYTFAPDGSDFTKVITGGINAFWSPDGSQIAYTRPYDGPRPGLAIADADGSNVREFGLGASGPWHPGTLENAAPEPTSSSSAPSPESLTERFDSTIHGISIDYPSGWQTRPATEPWTGGELSFDSPAADVIFDPTLGDRLYLVLASQPYGGVSQDAWRDGVDGWLCPNGGAFGSWRVDGADAFARECSGHGGAFVFTDTRGYLIWRVVSSDEPELVETYDWNWLKPVLETVDLRPEEALDALSPSESP